MTALPIPAVGIAPLPVLAPVAPVTPESQVAPAQPKAPPTNEQLIEVYVQLRDEADAIKARHQEELKTHNELMAKISGELDTRMAQTQSKSIGTAAGTASRIITSTPVCNDWTAFEDWFWANRRLDIFPRKLNVEPFKEMSEAGVPLPPGVRIEQSARVQIRRKTGK